MADRLLTVRLFRRNLRKLEREVGLSLATETDCCGVTVAQCHLLMEVEERGETGVTELAAALELDKSTLSRTVDGSWKAGLVSRETDPGNRRRQVVCLTEKGKAKARAINSLCDGFYSRLLANIPAAKRGTVMEAAALLAEAMKKTRKTRPSGCRCEEEKGETP